jgi:hypothetical protein
MTQRARERKLARQSARKKEPNFRGKPSYPHVYLNNLNSITKQILLFLKNLAMLFAFRFLWKSWRKDIETTAITYKNIILVFIYWVQLYCSILKVKFVLKN